MPRKYTKKSGIYAITNNVNGRIYIGQSKNIPKRWNNHTSTLNRGVGDNVLLQNDWTFLGSSCFTFVILECCETHLLEERECFYISLYKEQVPLYNFTDGGKGSNGYKHTDEAKTRMAESRVGEKNFRFGQELTEEHKQRISAAKKGKKKAPFTEEHRRHMSEAHMGKKRTK